MPNIPASDRFERMLRRSILYPSDQCVLWPLSLDRDGYGQFHESVTNRSLRVHREALLRVCLPEAGMTAAHSCINRHCFNQSHLSWKTIKANHEDKHAHGTAQLGQRNPSSKLTASQVREIRKSTLSQRRIAEIYGVTHGTIGAIKKFKTWGWLT